jgi:hypothetical protein
VLIRLKINPAHNQEGCNDGWKKDHQEAFKELSFPEQVKGDHFCTYVREQLEWMNLMIECLFLWCHRGSSFANASLGIDLFPQGVVK